MSLLSHYSVCLAVWLGDIGDKSDTFFALGPDIPASAHDTPDTHLHLRTTQGLAKKVQATKW